MAANRPASGLVSEVASAKPAATVHRRRLAAQHAASPRASPARNGHWPMALATTVLTANTSAAGVAPRPSRAATRRSKARAAPAAATTVRVATPTVAARGG